MLSRDCGNQSVVFHCCLVQMHVHLFLFSKVTVYLLRPLMTFKWKLGQEVKIRKNWLAGGGFLQDAIASSSDIIVKFSGLIN